MSILHPKKPEDDQDIEEFDSRLDILKFVSQVKSRIKKDVGSDFILAKLTEKQKEYIIENTTNAYFTKRMIEDTALKTNNPKDKTKINKMAARVFDTFMTRSYMIANLNRNVSMNYLLGLLAGKDEEVEQNETKEEVKGIIDKVKDMETGKKTRDYIRAVKRKIQLEKDDVIDRRKFILWCDRIDALGFEFGNHILEKGSDADLLNLEIHLRKRIINFYEKLVRTLKERGMLK